MPITVKQNYKIQLNKPKMHFVYIIHDKYISWEFCMRMLMEVFYKTEENANEIANEILTNGEAICGVYMFDIAETKATMVEELAKKEGFSLFCLVEEV